MIQGDMGTMGMGTVWGHLVCGQDMAGGTRVCVWQWVGAVAVHMCVRVPVRPLVCPGVPSSVPVYPGVIIPVSPRVPMCPLTHVGVRRRVGTGCCRRRCSKVGPQNWVLGYTGATTLGIWVPLPWGHGCHHPGTMGATTPEP